MLWFVSFKALLKCAVPSSFCGVFLTAYCSIFEGFCCCFIGWQVLDEAERSLHDALCVVRCLVNWRFLIAGTIIL